LFNVRADSESSLKAAFIPFSNDKDMMNPVSRKLGINSEPESESRLKPAMIRV
jgi:hypothetical protein